MQATLTPRLYELPGLYYEVGRAIDEADGEVTPEIEGVLAALDATLEDKADGIASLAAEADAEAAYFDAELDRLRKRRDVATRRKESLKSYLHRTLMALGRDKVKGLRFTVRVQRNSAPSIRWTRDIDTLPEAFRRISVDVDGTAAREAWKEGALPDGFEAVVGTHLRIA